jgi:hypothetical protein
LLDGGKGGVPMYIFVIAEEIVSESIIGRDNDISISSSSKSSPKVGELLSEFEI